MVPLVALHWCCRGSLEGWAWIKGVWGRSLGLAQGTAGAVGACPPRCSFGVHSHGPHHIPPVPHAGCPGLDPQDRVRMSGVSAGLGCQRGHNPGVLQTPGVSSSAATDTGARRHTRAFWVDAVSKQTEVELQPADSPPATAVSFRLRP